MMRLLFGKKICKQITVMVLLFGVILTGCKSKENSQINKTSNNQETDDYVQEGNETYRDFVIDNVLHSKSAGEIHYCLYVPEDYDGSEEYALFITLPGYQGLYFQGVAVNLKTEQFAFEAQKYNDKMIIAAPQLDDWNQTSANQTIALSEYLIEHYNIDTQSVFINGYSGGGETLSLVLDTKPELYSAALICSSKWDGGYQNIANAKVPVYFVIGENDEYYGSNPFKEAYLQIYEEYQRQGLDEAMINDLLVLDIKDANYFTARNIDNQHGGGGQLFSGDEAIMSWLFTRRSN